MILKQIKAGPFEANNYLIIDENTKKAAMVDASGDFEKVKSLLDEYGATLEKILLTHGHFDHIGGCYDFQKKLDSKVFIHKDDAEMVTKLKQQLQMFGMPAQEEPTTDGFIEDGEIIEVGDLKIKAIHTPGHTKGGICFVVENIIFSGDTIFLHSVGRTDLPGGSYKELEDAVSGGLAAPSGDDIHLRNYKIDLLTGVAKSLGADSAIDVSGSSIRG